MITIGADRFRSKAAASPEFGVGSGGSMNDDTSKRLESIEKALLSMHAGIVSMEKALIEISMKLETVLPHLATKAELATVLTPWPHLTTKAELAPVVASWARLATRDELQAMCSNLFAWIVGTALTSVAVLAGLMTLASRLSWHSVAWRRESTMKSRSIITSRPEWLQPPRPLPRLNRAGKPHLTMEQMIEKWAGVFEPEFWEEVRKARMNYSPKRTRLLWKETARRGRTFA